MLNKDLPKNHIPQAASFHVESTVKTKQTNEGLEVNVNGKVIDLMAALIQAMEENQDIYLILKRSVTVYEEMKTTGNLKG